ncbi:unnamed protein product [Prunus armeniaca]
MPASSTFNLVKPVVAHQNLPDSEIPKISKIVGPIGAMSSFLMEFLTNLTVIDKVRHKTSVKEGKGTVALKP